MRPPVEILKFLAIEGAENRNAKGVEGARETNYGVWRSVVSFPSGVRSRSSPGRKRVLEYL